MIYQAAIEPKANDFLLVPIRIFLFSHEGNFRGCGNHCNTNCSTDLMQVNHLRIILKIIEKILAVVNHTE